MSDETPSPNGATNGGAQDGRDPTTGRFVKGWRGGPGNPRAAEVAKHRAAFLAAIRDDDVVAALETIRTVMAKGRDGERLAAARELLDRILGKATERVILDKLDELEQELGLQNGQDL